jgi:hypothetical protein
MPTRRHDSTSTDQKGFFAWTRSHLPRMAVARALRREPQSRVDERDVGEGLREVADLEATGHVVFLGKEAEVVPTPRSRSNMAAASVSRPARR